MEKVRHLEMSCFELEVCAEIQQQDQTAKIRLNTVYPQVDGLVSYGNDALMPDQAYSSAPMDTGVDGLSFIHPESFNQANTENHGRTHSHSDGTSPSEARYSSLIFPQLSQLMLVQFQTEGCPPDLVRMPV